LATIVSDGKFKKLLEVGNKQNVRFHVSILAESAQILLTESENWEGSPGYISELDKVTTGNTKISNIFRCDALKADPSIADKNCTRINYKVQNICIFFTNIKLNIYGQIQEAFVLERGTKWVHLSFFLNKKKGKQKYEISGGASEQWKDPDWKRLLKSIKLYLRQI